MILCLNPLSGESFKVRLNRKENKKKNPEDLRLLSYPTSLDLEEQ